MKTKKDKTYSYNHTRQRLQERYGLELSREEYDKWCRDWTQGVRLQWDGTNMQEVRAFNYKGHRIIAVIKHQQKYRDCFETLVSTVLPPDSKGLTYGQVK